MADEILKRDQNHVTVLAGVTDDANLEINMLRVDPVSKRLLVSATGGSGSGTVTDVSVATANGFAGTVATSTTTPDITISTTVTGILQGNGTAISAIVVGSGLDFTGGTLSVTGGGTGDVVGPASSILDGIATFADTTGKLLASPTTISVLGATLSVNTELTSAAASYQVNGSTTMDYRFGTSTGISPEANEAGAVMIMPTAACTEAASGTHPFIGTLAIKAPSITDGVATTTLAATLWIEGNPTGTATPTTASALHVASGTSRFGGVIVPLTNDGSAIGTTALGWSDLFMATGAVLDFGNGNSVVTHSSAILTVSTGDLRVTTAGTNSASVVTVGGTQTLTNKTISNAILVGSISMANPSTDDTVSGISFPSLNAAGTIAQWDIVYLTASSTWDLTDADAAATAGPVMLAISMEARTVGQAMRVAMPGTLCRNDAWAWTAGSPLYLDTATPGGMTHTAPTGTDDVVRIVAYAVTADVIFWNPSNDFITIV